MTAEIDVIITTGNALKILKADFQNKLLFFHDPPINTEHHININFYNYVAIPDRK